MLSEYQIVKLKRPWSGLKAGAIGAIVMAYDLPHPGYEVEFTDRDGVTLALLTLYDDDLVPCTNEDLERRKGATQPTLFEG